MHMYYADILVSILGKNSVIQLTLSPVDTIISHMNNCLCFISSMLDEHISMCTSKR